MPRGEFDGIVGGTAYYFVSECGPKNLIIPSNVARQL
jgi:hypothetical protein